MLGKLLRALGVSRAAGRAIPPESLALLRAFLDEAARREGYDQPRLSALEGGRAVLAAAPEVQVGVLLAATADVVEEGFRGSDWRRTHARRALVSHLLRHGPALAPDDLERLAEAVGRLENGVSGWLFPSEALLGRLERAAAAGPLTPGTLAALSRWRVGEHGAGTVAGRKLRERVLVLTGRRPAEAPVLDAGEPWADAILAAGPTPEVAALVRHAGTLDAARPPARWLGEARTLLDAAADGEGAALARWLVAAAESIRERSPSDRNADALRGLCWIASLGDPATVAPALRALGEVAFQKVPGVGARSHKIGNACVGALGALRGTEGVARLGQLRLAVKYAVGRRLVEKALAAAAEQAGMAPEDLEDLAVPAFGLGPDGTARRALGGHVAVLAVRDGAIALSFEGADGKPYRSVPAEVKRSHARALADLRRVAKDAERMRAAQAARLEAAPLEGRRWPLERFRARWLEHPLLSDVARRLLWRVAAGGDVSVLWEGGAARDLEGRALELPADAEVRPWHPLGERPETVLAWRRRLGALGITQPFKQAHREIYVVTPAEQATRIYSNRFAGHVLRQHAFAALCRERGWQYHLQGGWDSANTPTLQLGRHGLRVELWLADSEHQAAESGAGVSLHVVTDQVRFLHGEAALPVEEVPPIVFSEAMRDVDLFVAVCSIGNDPTWRDRGERPAYDAYWSQYAFGELSELARTRRATLADLVPHLSIADRLTLDDRFLLVRGDRGTYKIHVGSGNVQTEAGKYLCIVRDGARRAPLLALPFEGDAMLSLVVSKAYLLANDRKIDDESILRQLR
ncbi:MAG TPA: DUF4132 domain-containing protein [Anaeromyxobacter sp.]|nr:DUF4132 domain-containing protein [Anaeromyxobacter sp.]